MLVVFMPYLMKVILLAKFWLQSADHRLADSSDRNKMERIKVRMNFYIIQTIRDVHTWLTVIISQGQVESGDVCEDLL